MSHYITAINPATEEEETIPITEIDLLSRLVTESLDAFSRWSLTPLFDRIELLQSFEGVLQNNKESLAKAITTDMGKPLSKSRGEVDRAIAGLKYFTEAASTWLESVPVPNGRVSYEPRGVVGVITPWNFPLYLSLEPILFSLLAGNSVIYKPSEYALRTGILLVEGLQEVLPKNLLHFFSGGKEHGKALVSHPDVKLIAFTGSTAAGKDIMRSAASSLKEVLLELGGLDAALVLEDVDIEVAAKAVVHGNTSNSGQACNAIKRCFVEDAIFNDFQDAVVEASKLVRIGDPLTDVDMGPLVADFQLKKAIMAVNSAVKSGGTVIAGGEKLDRSGYFFPSTVISNPPLDAPICTDEMFSPILPLLPVKSGEEAIPLVNDTSYGLTGSVWTKDLERGEAIASGFSVGVAHVNYHGSIPAGLPWGGVKESGIGRARTKEALHEYCDVKLTRVFPFSEIGRESK